MYGEQKTLDDLLKSRKISQRTYDLAKFAKEYIERKYHLKSIINTKRNNIIEKINAMNISEDAKLKIINEINKEESKKIRKKREKQTIRDYESIAIIGRGAFGEVHLCKETKTGNIYAIKKMKKDILIQKNQVNHIRSEQLFMSKVKSPWIVELQASFQEGDYLYLVMEYLPGGDFMGLLIKKDILTEDEARFYTAELILAVDSIHKLDCIHRDIKPDNILIGKDGHIKLSDFGLARVSDKLFENKKDENFEKKKLTHQKYYSCVGTAYYVAPEVLNKTGYGKDIDWWSVGVIFFEMLVGYAPFCSEETKDVCYKVLNWKEYLKIPDEIKISKEAEDLINKMINSSDKRLGKNGIEEIKSHPFFKGVDWDNIRSTKAPFIPELENDYDTKYFEKVNVEVPFHPPEERYKKRKDVEFLGYTYKEGNDLYEINNDKIDETINDIIKNYDINNNNINNNTNYNIKNNNTNDNYKIKNNNIKNNNNINVNKKANNNNLNERMISKKSYNSKIVFASTRIKGNSPPLITKLHQAKIKNANPKQKQLKTIKISDKRYPRLDPKISKSADVSVNKYKKKKLFINNNNKNNKYNYIRISPLNNKKVESPFNQRLIANKFKGSKIMNTSFKKVTSFKNVKEILIIQC